MTSKQRARLKSLASAYEPLFQIGKGGIGNNLVAAVSDALDARELIKLTVLKSAGRTPAEFLTALAERLNAEPVCAIGGRIVLYRYSPERKEHVEL